MRKLAISLFAATSLILLGTASFAAGDGPGNTAGSSDSGGEKPFGGNVFRDDEAHQQLAPEGSSEYQVGLAFLQDQKYHEAIPHLTAAVAKKPGDAGARFYLGYAHQMYGNDLSETDRDGELELAMQSYRRALLLDPELKSAHQYMGVIALQKHDLDSAETQAASLERLCPSGCDERDALTKAIAKYSASSSAAPAH